MRKRKMTHTATLHQGKLYLTVGIVVADLALESKTERESSVFGLLTGPVLDEALDIISNELARETIGSPIGPKTKGRDVLQRDAVRHFRDNYAKDGPYVVEEVGSGWRVLNTDPDGDRYEIWFRREALAYAETIAGVLNFLEPERASRS